ncbi:hypothetical protein [Wolbachia endosymbiont (group A) of Rhinocyllus conicus]|nr:hypothetical protein [Wolbachia endosymbiont (group A) of Rhinocyllus conicus]
MQVCKRNNFAYNLDPSGLCCIATYERLTIARIISNLLKILFFCNQSDQI